MRTSPPDYRTDPDGPDEIGAITIALLTTSNVLDKLVARSLERQGPGEPVITEPQFRLLSVVRHHEVLSLAALAQRLAVNSSTAQRMIERLEAGKLVERSVNRYNRREIGVALSPDGRAAVDRVNGRRRAQLAAILGRMTPTQRAQLLRALRAFDSAAGEPRVHGRAALGWGLTTT